MKTTTSLLALAAGLLVLGSATPSNAQYRPTGDDGITASPKDRQFLNEHRHAVKPATGDAQVASTKSVGYRAVGEDGIAASPKVRQALNERNASASVSGSMVASTRPAGYRAVGSDGIAASPKLRQQLDERSNSSFQIAPLK